MKTEGTSGMVVRNPAPGSMLRITCNGHARSVLGTEPAVYTFGRSGGTFEGKKSLARVRSLFAGTIHEGHAGTAGEASNRGFRMRTDRQLGDRQEEARSVREARRALRRAGLRGQEGHRGSD